MSGDNGWFQQNCDPSDDQSQGQQEVPSGGGGSNIKGDGTPVDATVNQIIENLVGQCYPSQSTKTIPNFAEPDTSIADLGPLEYDIGYIVDHLKGLGLEDIGVSSKIKIDLEDPRDPNSGAECFNDPYDPSSEVDCEEDIGKIPDCMFDHIECMLKPYAGGDWKPPNPDCENFFTQDFNRTSNRVCVKNCVPERRAVYEHVSPTNHHYSLNSTPPDNSYTSSSIIFYGHNKQEPRSNPLYVSYSASQTDTMLTMTPEAEQSSMDAYGMGSRTDVISYIFREKIDGISSLGDGEQLSTLHRYWNPTSGDHRYSLTPIGGELIEPVLTGGFYNIAGQVDADILIEFNCQRGGAAYKNTFGYYITDTNDNPAYGQVILPNATDATGYLSHTISKTILNQYAPCKIGFVMVPNGYTANGSSVAQNDVLTFSQTSNGWRTNLNSAEQNLSMFSERRLNWNNKNFTRWTSRWWQWWEDLLNGDDDYDDMKISYRMSYNGSPWYYEGIAGYVFKELVEPEFRELGSIQSCEDYMFDPTGFKNMEMARTGCGQVAEGDSVVSGCSNCVGDYMIKHNTAQTITAIQDGSISLRSHGGMTGGIGDCTVFKYQLYKNNVMIFEDEAHVDEWTKIGTPLHTFDIVRGDDVTFRVVSIEAGHYNASVTPHFALHNESTKEIINIFGVELTTTSHNVPDINLNCGMPGSFSLYDVNDSSNTVSAWSSGGGFTNNYLTVTPRPTHVNQVRTDDDSVGYIVRSIGAGGLSLNIKYESVTNGMRFRVESIIDMGSGGYRIGQLEKFFVGKDKTLGTIFRQGIVVNSLDTASCVSGGAVNQLSFGTLNEDNDVGAYGLPSPAILIASGSPTANYFDSQVSDLVEKLFAVSVEDTSSAVTMMYREPATLIQYWQRKNAAGEPVYFYHDFDLEGTNGMKLRMRAELIYKETDTQTAPETRKGYQFRWTVDSIISAGQGYADGMEFTWEFPVRDEKLINNEGAETTTPYYPQEKILPQRIRLNNSETSINTRTAKWGLYQSSHDRSSTVWYSNSSRSRNAHFRQFRFIIDDAV